MTQRRYYNLVERMLAEPRDFKLDEIYRLVCRPPHHDNLSTEELHSRCSRAIGEARDALTTKGYVLVLGDYRNSYRAVKRQRGGRPHS